MYGVKLTTPMHDGFEFCNKIHLQKTVVICEKRKLQI